MTSLWGDLPEIPVITTPAKILAEQAAALQEKTKGILVAEVVPVAPKYVGNGVANELRISVPALNKYTIRILLVEHSVLSYPCRAGDLFQGSGMKVMSNEVEFVAMLQESLSNPDLMALFANLIAQVQAVGS